MVSLRLLEVLCLLCFLLVTISTTGVVSLQQLRNTFIPARWMAVVIMCQCICLPAAAFGIALLFSLDRFSSMTLILVAACPPNLFSNAICFLTNSNLAISTASTVLTNILSLAVIPVNALIYGRIIYDFQTLSIPFQTIGVFAGCAVFGLLIGVVIAYFRHKTCQKISISIAVLCVCFFIAFYVYSIPSTSLYDDLLPPASQWQYLAAPLCVAVASWIVPLVIAVCCQMSRADAVSIAIQSSNQNGILVVGILWLNDAEDLSWQHSLYIPMAYGVFALGVNMIFVCVSAAFGWIDITAKKKIENFDDEMLTWTLPVFWQHYRHYKKMRQVEAQREFNDESEEEYVVALDSEKEGKTRAPVNRTVSVEVGVTLTYHGSPPKEIQYTYQ